MTRPIRMAKRAKSRFRTRLPEADFLVLHIQGCPGTPTTVEIIEEVLREEGIPGKVAVHEVKTEAEARALRFPGSPTIQMGVGDLFPLPEPVRYGLYCRVYNNEGITMSWPSKEAIRRAILDRGKIRSSSFGAPREESKVAKTY